MFEMDVKDSSVLLFLSTAARLLDICTMVRLSYFGSILRHSFIKFCMLCNLFFVNFFGLANV